MFITYWIYLFSYVTKPILWFSEISSAEGKFEANRTYKQKLKQLLSTFSVHFNWYFIKIAWGKFVYIHFFFWKNITTFKCVIKAMLVTFNHSLVNSVDVQTWRKSCIWYDSITSLCAGVWILTVFSARFASMFSRYLAFPSIMW